MAKLEIVNKTSWKQPFIDRKKEFHLWSTPTVIADYCNLIDGTKRLLQIQFEKHHEIDVVDRFQITSGREIRFPKNFQELIIPIVRKNPDSYFLVRVLDIDDSEEGEIEQFSTTGSATIKTRVGQSQYRTKLIGYWDDCCAVTGVKIVDILKASHIKPWSQSTDSERLDKYNGLLLNPMLDALFDKGFITFSDKGKIKISTEISPDIFSMLGIASNSKLTKIENQHKEYLKYHRNNIFRDK
jgi:predicted restriction endonuclease